MQISTSLSDRILSAGAQAERPVQRRAVQRRADQLKPFAHYLVRPFVHAAPVAFGALVLAVLGLAWLQRDEGYLTAESGAGYWLGIAGGLVMLFLLSYPLRKRVKVLQRFGRVSAWFRLHMMLGIIGPALVVLHTNFKLGSLNSRLALFTMLTVVASGIIGRYLYTRVHKGLYGQQAQLSDVLADIQALQKAVLADAPGGDAIGRRLQSLVPDATAAGSFLRQAASAVAAGHRARTARRAFLAELRRTRWIDATTGREMTRRQRRLQLSAVDAELRLLVAAVAKADRLAFFGRLLGAWHHLHMPLFALLAISVVMHIIAVHQY